MAFTSPGDREKGYPFKGYSFGADGMHDGGIWLENHDQLERFMFRVVPLQLRAGLEVMVCDNLDYAVFHAKDGRIIYPREFQEGREE